MRKNAFLTGILYLFFIAAPPALAVGGDVPIDSARGNYEGADNIHWYMQDTLQYEQWSADPPLLAMPRICNLDNRSRSCLGASTLRPLTLRSSNAPAPIAVQLEVDERIDFAWRYALKQIRDVNRMLADSGIRARLFVSDISSVNVLNRYSDSIEDAYNFNVENRSTKTRDNSADVIITVFSPDAAGAYSAIDFPDTCAIGTQGVANEGPAPDIQVIATACEDSLSLAHQLGHSFGLGHEATDANSSAPFVATGRGFIDQDSGIGSVMSTASLRAPFFSSPTKVVRRGDVDASGAAADSRIVLGSAAADSVAAANSTVWAVALANESVHGSGFDYESEVYWDAARGGFASVREASGEQESITLAASKDSSIFKDEPEKGISDGFVFAGRNSSGSVRRGLIAFDLSAIPSGSLIDSVALTLTISNAHAVGVEVRVHRLLADWGEAGTPNVSGSPGRPTAALPNDATWQYRFFDTTPWGNPGGDFVATASAVSSTDGTITWTGTGLRADVQEWVDNLAGNFGWLLIGNETTPQTVQVLHSRESVSSVTPSLVVTYTAP